MHRDAGPRAQVDVGLQVFGRIHVHGLDEPTWLVGADWQERQVHRTEAVVDSAEHRGVRRVPREIDSSPSTCQKKPAPQRAIPIERRSRRKMMCRGQRDPKFSGVCILQALRCDGGRLSGAAADCQAG